MYRKYSSFGVYRSPVPNEQIGPDSPAANGDPRTALYGVAEVLTELAADQFTGSLSVRSGHGWPTPTAYLIDGYIVAVDGADPATDLGRLLVASDIISDDERCAGERIAARLRMPLHELLASIGRVESPRLDQLRERHITETLLATDLSDACDFVITADDLPDDAIGDLCVRAEDIAAEHRRRAPFSRRLQARFAGKSLRVHAITKSEVADNERRHELLGYLEAPRTVDELVNLVGWGRWRALAVIELLLDKGEVRLEPIAVESHNAEPDSAGTTDNGQRRDRDVAAASIAFGRALMELGRHRDGVDAFRCAVDIDPNNAKALDLLEEANEFSCYSIYQSDFPAEQRFQTSIAGNRAEALLSPSDAYLLSRVEAIKDVRQAIAAMPMAELEALLALKRLKEHGFLIPA